MTQQSEKGHGHLEKSEKVSIIFTNIRCAISKKERLSSLVDLYEGDIVILTETCLVSAIHNCEIFSGKKRLMRIGLTTSTERRVVFKLLCQTNMSHFIMTYPENVFACVCMNHKNTIFGACYCTPSPSPIF